MPLPFFVPNGTVTAVYFFGIITNNQGRIVVMKARKGISYLEYALLAALVGIVGAVGVMKYGSAISEFFNVLAEKTQKATPSTK